MLAVNSFLKLYFGKESTYRNYNLVQSAFILFTITYHILEGFYYMEHWVCTCSLAKTSSRCDCLLNSWLRVECSCQFTDTLLIGTYIRKKVIWKIDLGSYLQT